MPYLIVGLGNIGQPYEHTRHNIGFKVLDYLAQNTPFTTNKLAKLANISYKGNQLLLIKPTTYMNNSGDAIHYWIQKLKLQPTQTLTITDDLHLPFGNLRLRQGGSDGGHKGLKSIATTLGTTQYPRLRLGISNHFDQGQKAHYVLDNFTPHEQLALPNILQKAQQIILDCCHQGITFAMNQHN